MDKRNGMLCVVVGLLMLTSAWGDVYDPVIVPAEFSADLTNPYLNFGVGETFVYEGASEDGLETIVVNVMAETRVVMGVTCRVVRDTVTVDGEVAEDTYDWYAQHDNGDVWYFGEDSRSYDGGVMSTEGSWEAGVDGAKPGIVMKASPMVGDVYRQEYYAGEAEDMAEVVGLDEFVSMDYGDFSGCLRTKEWTPLDVDVLEYKFYAPGVGLVLETDGDGEPLVSLVPEPTVMSMLGLAVVGLIKRRRRY